MVEKPYSSRAGLKKRMQCLKSKDKTVLEKKNKNVAVEWAIVRDRTSSTADLLQDQVQYSGVHSYKNILQSFRRQVPKEFPRISEWAREESFL